MDLLVVNTYCGGLWNNELLADWNGAKCIATYGGVEGVGCDETFSTIDPYSGQINQVVVNVSKREPDGIKYII